MTARIVPILIVVAAALCGIAAAHAQEIIPVTQTLSEEGLTIEGFTGGVGQSGPDANGGAIVIQQLLQQTGATTPTTAIAAPYTRSLPVSTSH